MSDIPEAIGGLVQGAVTAHAVEPGADGAKPGEDGHTAEQACLNCGTKLVGAHCHSCGQRSHIHRTLSAFFHDLLHGVLHFEGKLWRTLPVWLLNPGRLTREYIEGKRAKYVSPIALFLFVVFLTFALFNALGGALQWDGEVEPDATAEMQEAYTAATLELREAQLKLETVTPGSELETELNTDIAALQVQQATTRELLELTGVEVEGPEPELQVSGVVPSSTINDAWKKAKANPQLLIYKLQTNAYKFSWLLIPISVPFIWLLFPFSRKFRMYDHTVFVTYSMSFMIALIGLISLFAYLGLGFASVLLFYAPYHLYRQLRGTYSLSRMNAIWRLVAVSIFCWIAIGMFIVGLTMAVGT
ncbi:DUF3667 domain-containing protein [Altererythrobacter sp. ZODW24]|uniref:DUF3667 domain-containing protein n=1 Tax=Altererythrobacter sp. ZODW24 TaxID=2185142 RepID=UPI000DF7B211|nr:DUF3667 domain-containing protein [Altererythrobacter sp. ZODW24]